MKFYSLNDSRKVTISHYKLIEFLAKNGYGIVKFSGGGEIFAKVEDNILYEVGDSDLVNFVRDYLLKLGEHEVLEVFTRGVAGYLNKKKCGMLPEIKDIFDKDPSDAAWFYFKNTAVKVMDSKIEIVPYDQLGHKIWSSRILVREYINPHEPCGQFRDFVNKLAKSDLERFLALQTALGYLLHRHYNPALCKAIIFMDENIFDDDSANGGTGKSLLSMGLAMCKELVTIDGKATKASSRFKNQRIKHTTDVINYDDVAKSFSLEEIFSTLTSGFVIEQKGKQEIFLTPKQSPKVMISSNYIVNGLHGSSDQRRRYEYEVANYFNLKRTPQSEYGNLFFDEWDDDEWNRFDYFMMECTQKFLKHGLIPPNPFNLKDNKLIFATSSEFNDFIGLGLVISNTWICKKEILQTFISKFPDQPNLSSHQMTKWIKEYAKQNKLIYEDRKSGEKYDFYLKIKGEDIRDEE